MENIHSSNPEDQEQLDQDTTVPVEILKDGVEDWVDSRDPNQGLESVLPKSQKYIFEDGAEFDRLHRRHSDDDWC